MSGSNEDGSGRDLAKRWSITRRRFLHLSLGAAGAAAGTGWLTLPRGLGGRLTRGSFVKFNTDALTATDLPMLLQSPFLAMAALGDDSPPDPLDIGNHLRWAFQPELGFPDGGFDLYRRLHVAPRPRCVLSWPKESGQNLGRHVVVDDVLITCNQDLQTIDLVPPTGSAEIDLRTLPPVTIALGEPCRYVELRVVEIASAGGGGSGTMRATAFDGAVPVAEAMSIDQSGEQSIRLSADRIDHVVLAGISGDPMRGALVLVCFETVADSLCTIATEIPPDPTVTPPPKTPMPTPTPPSTLTPAPFDLHGAAENVIPESATAANVPAANATAADAPAGVTNAPDCLAGWTKLNIDPICLPLGDTSYPCHVAGVGPAESAEAQRRITPQSWNTYGPEFTHLRDVLAQIYHPPAAPIRSSTPTCPPGDGVTPPDEDPPSMAYDPLALVLVGAMEPNIARMVGLLMIDNAFFRAAQLLVAMPGPAATGVSFDYLIVGNYAPRTQAADVESRWNSLNQVVQGTVQRGVLTYQTPLPLTVKLNATTGADFGAPLALGIVDNVGLPLVITLNKPAEAIELGLDVPTGAFAIAHAYAADGTPLDAAHTSINAAGATRLLLLAEGIARVEIEGKGFYLGLTEVFRAFEPGGPIAYMVNDVKLGTPSPVAAPAMLDADPLPVLTRVGSDGAGGCVDDPGQMAAGLRWDANLPPSGILPRASVWYDVQRQPLGNGAGASIPSANGWQPVKNNVIVAPAPATCDPYVAPPGWPAQSPHLVDQPPGAQDRWFAYRVRGRDIFGRTSPWTVRTPVDLADFVAPPPPAHLTAKYLDRDDPYLSPDERVWTDNGGQPRDGIKIGWQWPLNLRRQAPDAEQIRFYLRRGRFNAITGHITQVIAPAGTGLVVLHTDVPRASYAGPGHPHQLNDFRGELLDAGGTLYPIVESDVDANDFLMLRYEPLAIAPPNVNGVTVQVPDPRPPPKPGSRFSMSLSPPVPLTGRVTAAVMQGTSGAQEVLLATDVRFRGAADDLAGNRFVSAGTMWTVIGHTTGTNFVLRLQQRPCAPFVPDEGTGFQMMAPDRVTPILLDPGNRHWQNMGDLAHWSERLHVEPIGGEPTGTVQAVDDNDDGTLTVTLNVTGSAYKPRFLGGEMVIMGLFWSVVGHVPGGDLKLSIRNLGRDQATGVDLMLAPGDLNSLVGVPFTYWPNIALPVPLPLDPREGTAFACVAASAADNKSHGVDPWPGGTLTGNEGSLSTPAIVMRVDRTVPSPPGLPANVPLVATPADFHGISYYNVRWVNGGKADMHVRIYRALADKDGQGVSVEPADLDRYVLITPQALRSGDHPDVNELGWQAIPANNVSAWQDRLDGKSRSKYFYKMLEVSPAGVHGAWSGAIGAVWCPSVVPPAAPVVTKVVGGEKEITIKWTPSRAPDVAGYRVYRTTDRGLAGDVRQMARVADILLSVAGSNPTWTDASAPVGVDVYYGVTAIDVQVPPYESAPSKVVLGRAVDTTPPKAPVWVSAEWVLYNGSTGSSLPWPTNGVIPAGYTAAIRLERTSVPGISAVYRREVGERWWDLVAWPTHDMGGAVVVFDLDPTPDKSFAYRTVSTNAMGASSPSSRVDVAAVS